MARFGAGNTPRHSLLLMERTLARLTRAELTEEVHQVIGLPLKESDIVVCTILDSIVRALRSGNKVEIRGFGTFNTRQRGWPHGTQSKDRRSGRGATEENSVLQSEQRTSCAGREGLRV